MASGKIFEEKVIRGEKAKYPFTPEYTEPTKEGYLFKGWKFNNTVYGPDDYADEEHNPFGPITEETPKNSQGEVEIFAQWEGFQVKCETNHMTINGSGDEETELTEIYFYAQTESGDKIVDGVTLESVSLDEGLYPIIFEDRGRAVEEERNIQRLKANINDMPFTKRYSKYKSKYKNVYSDVIQIEQFGNEEIVTPPFDYMTFTYTWGEDNGKDLDSATTIDISYNGLNEKYVGYGGDSSDNMKQYIEHGGDNTQSGDEGSRINFKKLINDASDALEGLTTINVDIYANWYMSKNRENPKMNFNFKTYTSPDDTGFHKEGYTFVPNPGTELASTQNVNDINVNAFGTVNALKRNVTELKKCYTKIITVEYNIYSKVARVIPITDSIGLDVGTLTFDFNGKAYTIGNMISWNVNNLDVVFLPSTNESGTLTFTDFSQIINNIDHKHFDVKEASIETYAKFLENYEFVNSGNDLLFNYTISQDRTTDFCNIALSLYTIDTFSYKFKMQLEMINPLTLRFNERTYTFDDIVPNVETQLDEVLLPSDNESGTLTFTDFSQIINKKEYNQFNVGNVSIDNDFLENYELVSSGDDLLFNYTINKSSTANSCNVTVTLYPLYGYNYIFKFQLKKQTT